MRQRLRLALAALTAIAIHARAGAEATAAPRLDLKAIETLATKWWKARPKTRFEDWDPKVRASLLAEAKALGPIPEGALDEVRDAMWRASKRNPPGGTNPGGKIATPYGEARWLQSGRGGKTGLVLGLHGGGEGAGDAGEAAGKWIVPGCMGMYPQGIRLVHDTWNTVHGERFALTLLEIAKVQHDVDPDRVYAMGFSMGGTGSWFLAGRHPDLLAAAAPCAGVLMASPKSQVMTKEEVETIQWGLVPNVRNLAMSWFAGLADDHCMPGTYLYAWEMLKDLRAQDAGGYEKLKFATYEGLGHSFPPGEPSKTIAWIATQRRDWNPSKLVWETATDPFPKPEDDLDRKVGRIAKTDFYWLHTDHPKDANTVVATVDRSGKDTVFTLDLGGSALSDWTIWASPRTIDPSKDVVVLVEGKEVFRGRPVPDVATVLETLDARLDRTLTYDRRIRLGS